MGNKKRKEVISISKLKEVRKQYKFNQKEMAREIGVSASYYYKVESCQQNPSYVFLVKVKKAFPQISIDEVFFTKTKRQ